MQWLLVFWFENSPKTQKHGSVEPCYLWQVFRGKTCIAKPQAGTGSGLACCNNVTGTG